MELKKLLLIATSVLCCTQVWARTLYVSAGQYSSIQTAIDDAKDGDSIIVSDGIYQENIDFLGKAITVRSVDPNDPNITAATIIDGSNPVDPNIASVVTFANAEDANSVLTGFTITGGTGSWLLVSWEFKGLRWNRCGGGVVCYNMSAPTISRNVFTGNSAGQGGGIYIYGDPVNPDNPSDPAVHVSPIITNNTFVNNSAIVAHGFAPPDSNYPNNDHGDGGAIVALQGCDATITGNLIENNHAHYYGGGIHLRQWSNGLIEDNRIISNDSQLGAGLHITYTSSPTVKENLIQANIAGGLGGGGIYVYYYSDPLIERNTITQNDSPYGAGIGIYTWSEPIIHNNLIVKNENSSGILCKNYSAPIITNNTITANITKVSGGGIFCHATTSPVIENNIISSNSAGYGIYTLPNSMPVIRYNDVWDNEFNNYGGELSDQTGINGNISADPNFVDQQNDDYHLKSNGWRWDATRNRWHWDDITSRCIDAGNPGYDLASETITVPDDPNGLWAENIRINMGAYGGTEEASLPPYGWALQADITNNGIANFKDFAILSQLWLETGTNIRADLDRNKSVNLADLLILTDDWLNQTSWH